MFQQQTGLGFSAWRRQLKIMEASRLLAEGESVSRVATELGYAQDSAFIAMFRRHAGLTPGQLKRLL
ncbi:helix-turn-helix domain-containing protein [Chromobacterium haemolyticum]|nr:helix-turn-helix domain-containing protein [Chromobacterium haemolyticum]